MSLIMLDVTETVVSKMSFIILGFQSRDLTAVRFARGCESETLPSAPLAAKDLSIAWSLGQIWRLGLT